MGAQALSTDEPQTMRCGEGTQQVVSIVDNATLGGGNTVTKFLPLQGARKLALRAFATGADADQLSSVAITGSVSKAAFDAGKLSAAIADLGITAVTGPAMTGKALNTGGAMAEWVPTSASGNGRFACYGVQIVVTNGGSPIDNFSLEAVVEF